MREDGRMDRGRLLAVEREVRLNGRCTGMRRGRRTEWAG
jgi:hypothetical protein